MLATVAEEGHSASEGPDVRREAVLLVVIPHLRKRQQLSMCFYAVVIISRPDVATCVSSRHSRKYVTLLKLMTELIFFSKLLENLISDSFF